MRVLISGGLGYLGGRLARFLAETSTYDVIIGSRQEAAPDGFPKFGEYRRLNWESTESLAQSCEDVDVVVNMAGVNAKDCEEDPTYAFEVNAVAVGRLLDASLESKVTRFIHFSTAHVYQSPLVGDISEKTCALNIHPYATSHRAGEDLVRFAHEREKLIGIVVRLSNSFGAPVSKDADCWMLLLNDLCRQAVVHNKLVLHSSPSQIRDFVPIEDVCHSVTHLMSLPREELSDGVFNVGGGWSSTILDMAHLVQQRCELVLGFKPEVVSKIAPEGEVSPHLDYKIGKLQATGFQSRVSRYDEIDALLEFCSVNFS